MNRTISIVFTLFLGAILLSQFGRVEPAVGQGGKTAGGRLPNYWKSLGMSRDQIKQVYQIQADYKTKVTALQKQIATLRQEEKTKLIGVLTVAQKDRLREIYRKKAGIDLKLPGEIKPPK